MRTLVILATVMSCQGVAPGEFTQPVVSGGVDSGDPAVGYVGLCSATLIGRSTVLTAAHCVGVDGSAATFCTSPCNNYYQCSGACVSGIAHVYPGYSGSGFDNDVAVISLSQDFTALQGTPPVHIGSAPAAGEGVSIVGFGCDASGCGPGQGNGIKRLGSTSVADVGTTLFDFNSGAQIGAGDWGGPAFIAGTDCEMGVMLGTLGSLYELLRVDAKLSWIQSIDSSVAVCVPPVCGDGVCQPPENVSTCPGDCHVCGDGVCTSPETPQSCPADCHVCGDGICQPPAESPGSCPIDCHVCGDGICTQPVENPGNCPQDCHICGDGICQSPSENPGNCPRDCHVCGDGICAPPAETASNCPQDCHVCGDGICQQPFETGQSCPQDCPECAGVPNGTACDGVSCCTGTATCQNGACVAGAQCCNTHTCCYL